MRKVTIVFFDAGGGHRNAAEALKNRLESEAQPWSVRLLNLQEQLDSIDVIRRVTGIRIQDGYNLILRKKGHQVARDSQHTHGNAIDFYLPNVTAQALQAWAKAQKLGGVGLYPDSGFVHMDTGPIRSWSGE